MANTPPGANEAGMMVDAFKADREAKIQGAARERYWDEMGIEQKVERLREVLQQLEHSLGTAIELSSRADNIAHHHQHGARGEVLMAVMSGDNRILTPYGRDMARHVLQRLK